MIVNKIDISDPSTKNYILTDESTIVDGEKLYRIQCTRDIPSQKVFAGQYGGCIRDYSSVSDEAWVSINAFVRGSARVSGYARINGHAQVFDGAKVSGCATIGGFSIVGGLAQVLGNAKVLGNSAVLDSSVIKEQAILMDSAVVRGNSKISGDCVISGNVSGYACVRGDAQILKYAFVSGCAFINGGVWENSPLYIEGSRWPFYMVSHDTVGIGCNRRTFDEWREKWLHKASEYSASDEVKEYADYFNIAVRRYNGGDQIELPDNYRDQIEAVNPDEDDDE